MTFDHNWKMGFENLLLQFGILKDHVIILVELKTRTCIQRSMLVGHVGLELRCKLVVDVLVESHINLTQPVLYFLPLWFILLFVHESCVDQYLCTS